MPLLVRVTPPPPPPPALVRTPLGVLTPAWYPPDGGDPVPLNPDGADWLSLDRWWGVTGAAPVQVTTDPHQRGGVRVRHVQPMPRTIIWPLRFRGRDHMDLVGTWREIVRKFTQTRRLGPGRLRISRPDGTAREIEAVYEGGFDGEPGGGWLEDTAVLQLLCPDPYWHDLATRSIRQGFSDPVNFYNEFMGISRGAVLGSTTVDNAGSVEAWPQWTITGPTSLVTATNHTTGESFEINPNWDGDGPLPIGETATITTDPPGVTGPQGQVWTGALNWPDAELWGLAPGLNEITFQLDGAAEDTAIEMTWRTRHETP